MFITRIASDVILFHNEWYAVNKSPYSLQFVQLSKTSPIRSHETLKSLDGALQLVGWLQRFLNNMNNTMMSVVCCLIGA